MYSYCVIQLLLELAGEYNAEVQKYKQQVELLEQQQRLLAMKIYHNRMVKHALEYKKKQGMKLDEGVMDYYRAQPDDADFQEKRTLKRAHATLAMQLKHHKRDKQLASVLAAATTLAAQQDQDRSVDASSASYKLTHALADIGVQLPARLQIGLPYGEDDVYYSDADDRSDDTASHGSDNEADIDELLDEFETSNADGKKRNPKKRKREDGEPAEANDGESPAPALETASAPTAKKTIDRRLKKKLLPPLPPEEPFSLFPTIRNALLASSSASTSTSSTAKAANSMVPFKDILAAVSSVPSLRDQVPEGITLTQMVVFGLQMLLVHPAQLPGFTLHPKQSHYQFMTEAHDSKKNPLQLVPWLRMSGPNPQQSDFQWLLSPGHPQNDCFESLEALFFFALTRRHFSADGQHLDLEQTRAAKATLTLAPPSPEALAEYREQEVRRYTVADRPFTYTIAHPSPGYPKRYIAGPNKTHNPGGGRKSAVLRAERPAHVTIGPLIRDALSRLPGGVGTRQDICSLVLQSNYIAPEVTDIATLVHIVPASLDRLHIEYDSCVRYDSDLKMYLYLHRHRSEDDFVRFKQLEERVKRGDTSSLWSAFYDSLDSAATPSAATLSGFLASQVPM